MGLPDLINDRGNHHRNSSLVVRNEVPEEGPEDEANE